MNIIVTGGAGFIGSHLCRRVHADGHSVICVDNLISGSKANVDDLLASPRFEFVRHDVIEPIRLEAEQLYHLACPASPVHYQKNAIRTVKANVLGTLNMLGLAKRTGARLLQASTSEVYGDPAEHPQTEAYWGNVNPYGPRACYDEGKRVAETLCFSYEQAHGMDVRIARIFNTYGPAMLADDGRVVSNFIVQALRREPLTIYGDGAQTRSFCYVDDLVEGLVALMASDTRGPVNLGNPDETTVLDLARLVSDLVAETDPEGRTARDRDGFDFKPLPVDDPTRRLPDISRATAELSWSPSVSLREGLTTTVADFRARLESARP